jgi:hypothetical protein
MKIYTINNENEVEFPWWFSWDKLHLSHKCSLLRKKPNGFDMANGKAIAISHIGAL